jgi:hypothetical protein
MWRGAQGVVAMLPCAIAGINRQTAALSFLT